MANQNLHFNILTFDWHKEKENFYFGLEEIGHCQKIHKSIFPNEIENIFPGVTTGDTEFIYTTFTGEREGFQPLEIDLPNENPAFTKRYYLRVSHLKQFEAWMLQDDLSITTVGICTRCLRAMFNEADFLGIIKKDKCYPFGRRKYRLPTSRNIKKALPMTDVRAKTDAATRENSIPISIFINEEMNRILKDWGTKENEPDDYIFPVLTKEMSSLVQYEQLGLFVRSVNDWMAKIRTKLGIKRTVTTYVARHTFSTVLKKAGVSTEYIREALGHTSIQTTENYLDSFEKEMKKEYANKLMAFKEINSEG